MSGELNLLPSAQWEFSSAGSKFPVATPNTPIPCELGISVARLAWNTD